jgi:GAF domain-containing protein
MAQSPEVESARLRAVSAVRLNRETQALLSAVATEAASALGTCMAMVSLIGEHHVTHVGRFGTPDERAATSSALCAYVLHDPQALVVQDAMYDSRFADHPHVLGAPFVRFFAGAAVRFQGHVVGAISVQDVAPKTLSRTEITHLLTLASRIENLLDP